MQSTTSTIHRPFGTTSEHLLGGRRVRIYRALAKAKTGSFVREATILTFFIRGGAVKKSRTESQHVQCGSLGILRFVDVQQITILDKGAMWLNIELEGHTLDLAETLLANQRSDVVRINDPTVLPEALQLLRFLRQPVDSSWDQEEIVERIIARLLEPRIESRDTRSANRLREFIHDNYGSDMSLKDACTEIGSNPSHVGREFKRRYGHTPGEYLRRVRLRKAFELVADCSQPLIEIANECGFSDESHLCRTFKKYTSWTPTMCRRILRNQLSP